MARKSEGNDIVMSVVRGLPETALLHLMLISVPHVGLVSAACFAEVETHIQQHWLMPMPNTVECHSVLCAETPAIRIDLTSLTHDK